MLRQKLLPYLIFRSPNLGNSKLELLRHKCKILLILEHILKDLDFFRVFLWFDKGYTLELVIIKSRQVWFSDWAI